MLFMTNKNTPKVVERTAKGTISTKIANKIPNHISAKKYEQARETMAPTGSKYTLPNASGVAINWRLNEKKNISFVFSISLIYFFDFSMKKNTTFFFFLLSFLHL